jgi:hypothetical protein
MRFLVLCMAMALTGCAGYLRGWKGPTNGTPAEPSLSETSFYGDTVTVEITNGRGQPYADQLLSGTRVRFPRGFFTESSLSAESALLLCSDPIGNMSGVRPFENEGEAKRRYEMTRTCGELLMRAELMGWLRKTTDP